MDQRFGPATAYGRVEWIPGGWKDQFPASTG